MLRRSYPPSSLLRTSPPPPSAQPVPRGFPVASGCPRTDVASLVALLTRLIHADTITPVELQSAVVSSSAAKAFAKYGLARLPKLPFRGLLDVHCTFRPVSSPSCLKQPSAPGTPTEFVTSLPRLIANRPSRPDRMGIPPIRSTTPSKAYPNFQRSSVILLDNRALPTLVRGWKRKKGKERLPFTPAFGAVPHTAMTHAGLSGV